MSDFDCDDKTNDIELNKDILYANNKNDNQNHKLTLIDADSNIKERFLTYNKWKCLNSEDIQENYELISNQIKQEDKDSLEKELLGQEIDNLGSYNIGPISDADSLMNSKIIYII